MVKGTEKVQETKKVVWTQEMKDKQAAKMREVFADPELREKLRVANTGRVMTEETKEKIRVKMLERAERIRKLEEEAASK